MAMRISPQSDATTIVLLGSFSPSIFHPAWFAAQKAIGAKEAADAEISVLHPEVTSFKTSKLTVEVQPNRFVVASELIPQATQDLVVSVFGGSLIGTPINAMGVNRTIHFDTGSAKCQHAVGRLLAPLQPWGAWGKVIEQEDHQSVQRGGMISLRMQQTRTSGPPGYVQVRVEPSALVKMTGIFVEINNHYVFDAHPPQANDSTRMIDTIKAEWAEANRTAEVIADQLMALAEGEEGK